MGCVALEEKFRVPLDSQQKPVLGRLDRFDDSVGSDGARNQRRRHPFDGLMMGAVHHQGCPIDNFPEQALGCHRHRMRHMDRFFLLAMVQRMLNLRRNVLEEAATARDIDRLHASANS